MDIHNNKFRYFYNFVELLRQDQLDDFDCMVAVTSRKGFGKSSTGLKIAESLYKTHLNKSLDLREIIAFTPEEVNDKIDSLQPYSCLLWDEAVMGALGEDWNKAVSKILKKRFTTCRTKHLIIILNIPDIRWLDKKYSNSLITHWIHIVSRGLGVWFSPNPRPATNDCWQLDIFDALFPKKAKIDDPRINPNPILKKLLRHPCAEESMAIPKINDELYQRYITLRDQAVYGDPNLSSSLLSFDEVKKRMIFCLKRYIETQIKNGFNLPKPSGSQLVEILRDPLTGEPLARRETINRWLKEIGDKVSE